MAALNEASLKEKLRDDPVGVYLIYGEESYLKKIYTDRIVKKPLTIRSPTSISMPLTARRPR